MVNFQAQEILFKTVGGIWRYCAVVRYSGNLLMLMSKCCFISFHLIPQITPFWILLALASPKHEGIRQSGAFSLRLSHRTVHRSQVHDAFQAAARPLYSVAWPKGYGFTIPQFLGCSIFSETRKYHVFFDVFLLHLLLYPILSQYIHVHSAGFPCHSYVRGMQNARHRAACSGSKEHERWGSG